MPEVRIYNPRQRKELTHEEVERRQEQAVAYAAEFLGDEDLADELESLSVGEYAQRRGFQLTNPGREEVISVAKQQELDDLKGKVKELEGQLAELKQRRNPKGPGVVVLPSRKRAGQVRELHQDEREELLSAIERAQDALEEGRLDQAQEALDKILDEYEVVDEDEENGEAED